MTSTQTNDSRLQALVATSDATPLSALEPLVIALEKLGVGVRIVNMGRLAQTGSFTDNLAGMLGSVVGESGRRELHRALNAVPPDVAVALDASAASALSIARDELRSCAPVVGVVTELTPEQRWGDAQADRYVTIDDDAAVGLEDCGVEADRVLVGGAIASARFATAAKKSQASLRKKFGLTTKHVACAVVDDLGTETTRQIALQLSLTDAEMTVLFDAGTDNEAASVLRQQVPTLDLKAKLFGRTPDAPAYWRAADIIIGTPSPLLCARAMLMQCKLIALAPSSTIEVELANALQERDQAVTVPSAMLLASAFAEAAALPSPARCPDGANSIAQIVAAVGLDRQQIVNERLQEARRLAQEIAAASVAEDDFDNAAGGLEDLSGPTSAGAKVHTATIDDADITRLRASLSVRTERTRKEVFEARAAAEQWCARKEKAQADSRQDLAREAAKAEDDERRRMHSALQDLAALEKESAAVERAAKASKKTSGQKPRRPRAKARAKSAPAASRQHREIDDLLEDLKATTDKRPQPETMDDELEALKRKMRRKK